MHPHARVTEAAQVVEPLHCDPESVREQTPDRPRVAPGVVAVSAPAAPVEPPLSNEPAGAHEALLQFLYRAPIGLVQTSLDGAVEMINPMAANLLIPLSRSGDLDNLFAALDAVAPQLRALAAAFRPDSGSVCESIRITLPAGAGSGAVEQALSVSLLKLDATRLMAMVRDITLEVQREQSVLSRKLAAAARKDSLTHMPNRAVVRELIQRAIVRARAEPGHEFAVLFVNCDRFKRVNDTLGHPAGDEVLGLIADRLRAALRQHDRDGRTAGNEPLAGRLGGDEFVVVLDELRSPDEVHAVARRLLDVLSQPFGVQTYQLHLSVSIGVVLRAQVTADADAVLQDASIAMVEAKRAGGARHVVFEPSMQVRASRRGELEMDLRQALREQQLFVVYQPVVALQAAADAGSNSAHSAGVEALVRWRHPTRGVLPPIEFIGVAEECGMIGVLGEFVLATACHQFAEWQRDLGGRAPRLLAVNLSRRQLSDPGLGAAVGRILESSGVAPARLQLEVTESLAAQDDSIRSRLQELRTLGLTLALDDFGTGYSSLASLHQLPVGTVKIDRSFVSEAVASAHHRVLIEATIRVASSLGMGTVAEGIETAAQAALLRQLGCDKGQGYFFSKPLSAADLVQWLASAHDPVG
jgi:diguanylate cyclase (GGDEF)-like protein